MSQRKLQTWQEAGLIDSNTVSRILDYESAHAKPLGLWAIIGVGALAIGLGLISVVAANWDAIPGTVRLALHFSWMIAMAGWIFWQLRTTANEQDGIGKRFFSDAGLFILGALALTFFGHIGQVYQTSSPLWQPLLFWLILFTPALLCLGRSWLTALAWMAGIAGTVVAFASWYVEKIGDIPVIFAALLSAIPPVIIVFAAYMRSMAGRSNFWRRLEQIALILLVITVALFHLAAEVSGDEYSRSEFNLTAMASIQIVIFGAITAIIFFIPAISNGRDPKSPAAISAIVAAAAGTNLLAALNGGQSQVASAIFFMLFWAIIAAVSLRANWRTIFQVAVGILAVRLIVLSFQLGIDLLGSGLGLILAGVITLAIAWGAVRFSKNYAPPRNRGEAA